MAESINGEMTAELDLDSDAMDPTGRLGKSVPVIDISDLADGVGQSGNRYQRL